MACIKARVATVLPIFVSVPVINKRLNIDVFPLYQEVRIKIDNGSSVRHPVYIRLAPAQFFAKILFS
ncbi:hypothetical protein PQM29_000082 [Morganella morganii]|uniref:hypothetical protein n=1 Tax=Morganella morganii TaxID=582 RepID=UPI0028109037|nr:hypothetical protein [Morganella morganii]MDF5911535.1 hypothetical protein [Morganella morganii]